MPIANCFIEKTHFEQLSRCFGEQVVQQWAKKTGVDVNDITFNILMMQHQFGNRYPIMVNLYLPSLWNADEIQMIQSGLGQTLSQQWDVDVDKIFIMTSIIQSGHVIENGTPVSWD